jgi:pimeloyl-ACP methyl ester carboxylesterase
MIHDYQFAPGEQLNIIAHSNGGNVALEASQLGLDHKIDNLITLGTPNSGALLEGEPNSYEPNPNAIGAWYNIQASTDWVPYLDEIGSQFNRRGALNYVVPTSGFNHIGSDERSAHSALYRNAGLRDQWWAFWQQNQPQCARTGAYDDKGNSTGWSGCQ